VPHKTSPSRLFIMPSHTFAGNRVPAAAAGPPPSSSLLRRFSKPGDLPSTFSGSHGSSPCSTWMSQALHSPPSSFPRARCRCSAAAARRRLPRAVHRHQSITGESNRQSLSLVCLRACHRRRARGGGTKGICVRILKVLGFAV
jgi:hypothetical protein